MTKEQINKLIAVVNASTRACSREFIDTLSEGELIEIVKRGNLDELVSTAEKVREGAFIVMKTAIKYSIDIDMDVIKKLVRYEDILTKKIFEITLKLDPEWEEYFEE